jgi:hypothetical protein
MASASSPSTSPSKKVLKAGKAEHHDNLFAPEEDHFSDESDGNEVEMENFIHKVLLCFGSIKKINIYMIFVLQTCLISPTNEEYDMLVDHLRMRMEDNHEETIYVVGTGGESQKCCKP